MQISTPAWIANGTAMNKSDYNQPLYCTTMFYTLNILIVIVALVGVAGNAIVLWLLGFRLHMDAFSVYIFNLAGADFLFLFFQTLCSLDKILSHFYIKLIGVPMYLFVVFNCAYFASLGMLSAISTERCMSALWPVWYRCRRPRHTSAIICALLWALSLTLSLLEGKACGTFFDDSAFVSALCKKLCYIIFAWLIVLFVVLSGSSLALMIRVFCGSHRIPVTRLYVTVALTVMAFLLFGLSYGIYWFLLVWVKEDHGVFLCHAFEMTMFLSCVNSCANPIIYFLVGSIRHHQFQRQTLKMLLQRAMQDTPEKEGGDRSSSGQETI
ncbi:mas-related G-protein coupled receptor member B1-like [Mesocricetus auratus]|uniref:Mas-related G-protein coupled receptor member B1-like n=1 Tax=Mesocricetus auratus TaxID=10036 RepID=A0A1U8CIJ1_MESAU|nr:mas-related G-protein coupled receptor member B1-like [Mesocricetus auratus]